MNSRRITMSILFVFTYIVLLCVSVASQDAAESIKINDHLVSSENIELETKAMLCATNNCCTIDSTHTCPLTDISSSSLTSTLIFPGGNTRCVVSTSNPYAFQVLRGDPDKLFIYFEGGGNCFTDLGCTSNISPIGGYGVFNKSNPLNPFRSYTQVFVSYCSGDFHIGNNVGLFNDTLGEPVQYRGLVNVASVLSWIVAQVNNGGLSSTLNNLILEGSSAGSLGVQFWSKRVLDTLSWKKAAVIPDSAIGVGLEDQFSQVLSLTQFCTYGLSLLTTSNKQACSTNSLKFSNFILQNFQSYPNVPFAYIQSKTDAVQINTGYAVPPTRAKFFYDSVVIINTYQSYSNFLIYFVNGGNHGFGNDPIVYTTNAVSKIGGTTSTPGAVHASLTLIQWLSLFPLSPGSSASSQCDGVLVQASANSPNVTYCPSSIIPKTFTSTPANSPTRLPTLAGATLSPSPRPTPVPTSGSQTNNDSDKSDGSGPPTSTELIAIIIPIAVFCVFVFGLCLYFKSSLCVSSGSITKASSGVHEYSNNSEFHRVGTV